MPKTIDIVENLPVIEFATVPQWERWLMKNCSASSGLWLRFYKKQSGVLSIDYSQALDVALCYGWIDSKSRSLDEVSWVQKFTPRRSKSPWSKVNRERVERLIRDKRMKPEGLREIELAKADGRWDRAYDPPSTMELPPEFLAALAKDVKAKAFFETLNKSNTYAIAYRLQTAKRPETKIKRMQEILAMLSRGEKFH